MDIIKEIEPFEKDFIKAGELALELRQKMTSRNKYNTGDSEIDVVTSADLEIQEFILTCLAKTNLVNCELIAEEDTPSENAFAKSSKYVLTLDPIDGTKLYAHGKKMFSVVVTIHDKKNPIYSFCYYPAVKWGIKIAKDKIKYIGTKPKISTISKIPPKSIIYFERSHKLGPEKTDPKVYQKLIKEGYSFIKSDDVSDEAAVKAPFLLGVVAGEFIENGAAVDSLTELHFAMASKLKIYRNLDLSKPASSPRGNYYCYRGYYFITR